MMFLDKEEERGFRVIAKVAICMTLTIFAVVASLVFWKSQSPDSFKDVFWWIGQMAAYSFMALMVFLMCGALVSGVLEGGGGDGQSGG